MRHPRRRTRVRRPARQPVAGARPERELRVRVEGIAAGGDGVARVDGLVVFVPRTAPGDEGIVRATVGRSFARGRLTTLERASPLRAEPPCAHYTRDDCGGCQLQHLEYAAQLEAKRRIVADAFARIARQPVEVPPVEPSPEPWRYRTKLTLTLRRRTPDEALPGAGLAPRDSGWVAGLHPYDDPVAVFPLADCPITDERVLVVWRAVLAAGDALPDAEALRVAVRLTSTGAAVVVQGGERWTEVERFAAGVPAATEIWWGAEGERPQVVHGRAANLSPDMPDELEVAEPGASFVQVNAAVAESLRAHVLALARRAAPASAVDAYAGTGPYALALAAAGVRVTAIERDSAAAAFLSRRLPAPSAVRAAPVEQALGDALPADLVIVNPPRGGLHAAVCELLATVEPRPARLLYVSCNPATLARDVGRLPGWRVASVRPFDMFPQTAHVETVCELVPEER